MTIVRQVLAQKGAGVHSVTPNTKIRETLKLMADKDIGAVLVTDGDNIEGIFSERDFAREAAQNENINLDIPIRKLMTKLVYYVPPAITMDDCMALMTEKRIRHLPVVENGQLKGIISIGDVVREVISLKDVTIQSLENYIMGRGYNQ